MSKKTEIADVDFALAAVAQGVINIAEGVTTAEELAAIEKDSRIYRGMEWVVNNRKLIAAAPEMVAVLVEMYEFWKRSGTGSIYSDKVYEVIKPFLADE